MCRGVNGRQGAVTAEEVAEDIVKARGLLGVCFRAVGVLQPAHSVYGDAVGAISNYVACPTVRTSVWIFLWSHSSATSFAKDRRKPTIYLMDPVKIKMLVSFPYMPDGIPVRDSPHDRARMLCQRMKRQAIERQGEKLKIWAEVSHSTFFYYWKSLKSRRPT